MCLYFFHWKEAGIPKGMHDSAFTSLAKVAKVKTGYDLSEHIRKSPLCTKNGKGSVTSFSNFGSIVWSWWFAMASWASRRLKLIRFSYCRTRLFLITLSWCCFHPYNFPFWTVYNCGFLIGPEKGCWLPPRDDWRSNSAQDQQCAHTTDNKAAMVRQEWC